MYTKCCQANWPKLAMGNSYTFSLPSELMATLTLIDNPMILFQLIAFRYMMSASRSMRQFPVPRHHPWSSRAYAMSGPFRIRPTR